MLPTSCAWSGQLSLLSHARLRAACPCSQCRAARLHGRIDAAPSDVRLRAINRQGYGVQLVFSDGHDQGIYPWSYLRELAGQA
ncbi:MULTISPECIES: gamma-butyrobetaine hydroxylase-like domain-containing protein [unclassified Pseudomonas]|uniref:DUF971 domain-containing protein n=1 Tax=unclassified Pseudomonas TaxID=196821 RepID=UPI00244CF510|nr:MULTISPECIES: gamma-butyrobetaine hydroxylase-like domain-containing protein [unclassified Pseudomonas]MDG9924447.1 gamma-butyrobetaine hydroxylase-like domain-containing protein [Pseudomonas sp. GD04045]MDH0035213.1 gamma-butyrobetaine hydroxylase-like domain-containing protein [Pseudomonas sp. GD04019]